MPDDPKKWYRTVWTRSNILMTVGIVIMLASWINSEVLGRTFHYEYLIAGLALCGVSITQWGDKR